MKRIFGVLLVFIIASSLSACGREFSGSRTGNDSRLIMTYDVLNKTESQDLKLAAGDTISAKIVVKGGRLSIKIRKDGQESIYEGDGIIFSNEFDVVVEEDGIYTVEVTGKRAKGSVSFVKK